ncbi:MAG: LysM peptidoglycan-binding domain-containing protein [Chloroflexota bacterium]
MDVVSAVGGALGLLKPDKAKLVCTGSNLPSGPTEIECMFNPTEYRINQTLSVTRNQTPAKSGGTPQFSGTNAMTLTLQLFFDDFGSMAGDVTPKITTLLSWTHATQSSHDANRPCPPLVAFRWGGNPQLAEFSGYLKSVGVNYTIFRKDGTPVQAKVDISIEGQQESIGGQNPTSHSINSRRVATVVEGDSLQSIAYRELGKPAYWRAIAELNGIDDPMRITPGTTLLIPSLADAARGS